MKKFTSNHPLIRKEHDNLISLLNMFSTTIDDFKNLPGNYGSVKSNWDLIVHTTLFSLSMDVNNDMNFIEDYVAINEEKIKNIFGIS